MKINARQMMADTKFYESYSRWIAEKDRKENWSEAIDRVMATHREKYKDVMTPELSAELDFATKHYKKKHVLGAQRVMQFGGEQLLKHQARAFNCTVSYADRVKFFGECLYLLLCGAGVGFSVQRRHINKLPNIQARNPSNLKVHIAEDSIEGWADCFKVLLSFQNSHQRGAYFWRLQSARSRAFEIGNSEGGRVVGKSFIRGC
jgi:ribonucleoside-diphosphate reductase alpha chain